MHFTYNSFLLVLLSFNLGLFASQPLKKSGPIAIPTVTISESTEPNSLESCRSIFSSAPASSEASPKNISPSRSNSYETEEIVQKLKDATARVYQNTILVRLQYHKINASQEENFVAQLQKQLEKKLTELALIMQREVEKNEESLAISNIYYEYPGSNAKICSLKELKAAEEAAFLFQLDCP